MCAVAILVQRLVQLVEVVVAPADGPAAATLNEDLDHVEGDGLRSGSRRPCFRYLEARRDLCERPHGIVLGVVDRRHVRHARVLDRWQDHLERRRHLAVGERVAWWHHDRGVGAGKACLNYPLGRRQSRALATWYPLQYSLLVPQYLIPSARLNEPPADECITPDVMQALPHTHEVVSLT